MKLHQRSAENCNACDARQRVTAMASNLFDRLDKKRPPRRSETDNSGLARDLQKLHDWIQHTKRSTIRMRDLCYLGPSSLRKREKVISLTDILVRHGWLVPMKVRRYDRREWQIVRAVDGNPTIAAAPRAPITERLNNSPAEHRTGLSLIATRERLVAPS
jgi:hypothetical protein